MGRGHYDEAQDRWVVIFPDDESPEEEAAAFSDSVHQFANVSVQAVRTAIDRKSG